MAARCSERLLVQIKLRKAVPAWATSGVMRWYLGNQLRVWVCDTHVQGRAASWEAGHVIVFAGMAILPTSPRGSAATVCEPKPLHGTVTLGCFCGGELSAIRELDI